MRATANAYRKDNEALDHLLADGAITADHHEMATKVNNVAIEMIEAAAAMRRLLALLPKPGTPKFKKVTEIIALAPK